MLEQGGKSPAEARLTAEEENLVDYLGDFDPLSVRGQAVLDSFTQAVLYDNRITQLKNLFQIPEEDKFDIRFIKSNIRITEGRLAILEDRIDEKTVKIPGYREELKEAENRRERIIGAISLLTRESFQNDEASRAEYMTEELNLILLRISEKLLSNAKPDEGFSPNTPLLSGK